MDPVESVTLNTDNVLEVYHHITVKLFLFSPEYLVGFQYFHLN